MVEIKNIDTINKTLEVDGVKINVDEYNEKIDSGSGVGDLIRKASYGNITGLNDSFFEDVKWCAKNHGWLYGSLFGRIENGKFIKMRPDEEGGAYLGEEKQQEEISKSRGISPQIYKELAKRTGGLGSGKPNSKDFRMINLRAVEAGSPNAEKNIQETIETNNQIWKDNLTFWKETIALAKHLKIQRDETGQEEGQDYVPPQEPDNREERNEKWKRINDLRVTVFNEIKAAMPMNISKQELTKPNWAELLENARSEKEINDLKKEVLADIERIREAKKSDNNKPITGQELKNFARNAIYEIDTERNKDEGTEFFVTWEELEENNPDWRKKITNAAEAGNEKEVKQIKVKVLVDLRFRKAEKQKVKNQAASLDKSITDALNSKVDEMNDNQMAELMELFQQWEGENKVESLRDKSKSVEEKLIENNPDLYRQTVINALLGRIKEYKINSDDLSEETKQLLGKEITDIEKFKEAKDRAIKEIGEVGAKSKWDSLFNKAQALFQRAKQSVTEQVRKDLQTIQKQLKSLKDKSGGANSYLTSIYQNDKSKFDKLEKDLSNYLSQGQTGSPSETPWGIIIPVSLVALSLIGIAAAIIVRKRNKAKRIVE